MIHNISAGAGKKQGNVWVCTRESASASEVLFSAIRAYASGSNHHARGACKVSSSKRYNFTACTKYGLKQIFC